jgi:hypothetical protein
MKVTLSPFYEDDVMNLTKLWHPMLLYFPKQMKVAGLYFSYMFNNNFLCIV